MLETLIIKSVILFLQNSWGIITKPYRTYRRLSRGKHLEQILPLTGLVIFCFWFINLIHYGLRPFLVAVSWAKTSFWAGAAFSGAILSMYTAARFLKGKGGIKNLLLPWAYSLLPTLAWFFLVAASYALLPPPRSPSFAGKTFSFLFIVFSLTLLSWKIVLYYLTLRFGMKLDLIRIIFVSLIIFPIGALYSLIMYKLKIFRIPFI